MERKRPFYGWVIVALGIVILAASVGIAHNCIALYLAPICDELGFSRSAIGMLSTFRAASSMVAAAISAGLYSRFPVRRTMQVSAIVLTLTFYAYSLARRLWHFYLVSLVNSFALWLLAYIPFAVLLANWFYKRTGTVIGVAYMGTGLGGMVFSPIVGSLIAGMGWRGSIQVMTAVIGALVIPSVFLLRDRPEDMGLKPYGYTGEREDLPHRDSLPGIPFTEARHSGRFLVMTLSIALLGFCSNGFYNSFAPYMNDVGYSVEEASRVISIMMGALAIGKASLGWIYDKLGVSAATGLSGVFMCACIAAALFMPGKLPLVIIIAGFSIGFAFGSVAIPLLAKAAFGPRDFSRVNGAFNAFSGVITAFAGVFGGYVYDVTGSYRGSFYIYVAITVIFIAAIMLCLRKGERF